MATRFRVKIGMKFNSHYADSNPEWTVIKSKGNGCWLCRITDCLDWGGTEKVFQTKEIKACVEMRQMFDALGQRHDDYYASLTPGRIVHYNNGGNSYVRCLVVQVNDENKLKPIALVGKWLSHDLPQRRPNGEIYLPYYPRKIAEGELFTPNASCIYECEPRPRDTDPRGMKPLSLEVPKMTTECERQAGYWQVVERAQAVLSGSEDPPQVRIEKAKKILGSVLILD